MAFVAEERALRRARQIRRNASDVGKVWRQMMFVSGKALTATYLSHADMRRIVRGRLRRSERLLGYLVTPYADGYEVTAYWEMS